MDITVFCLCIVAALVGGVSGFYALARLAPPRSAAPPPSRLPPLPAPPPPASSLRAPPSAPAPIRIEPEKRVLKFASPPVAKVLALPTSTPSAPAPSPHRAEGHDGAELIGAAIVGLGLLALLAIVVGGGARGSGSSAEPMPARPQLPPKTPGRNKP